MTQEGVSLPPRTSERLLIEALTPCHAAFLLCNTLGRGQLAREFVARHAGAGACCLVMDLYQHEQARKEATERESAAELICAADFPPVTAGLAAIAVRRDGDAELTRELIQQSHERMAIGGQLVTATDNPRDQWLHEQMRLLFEKVSRRPQPDGVVYLAAKTKSLKKIRDFSCQFAFRDRDRLLDLRTRPGVFSHRSLDGGARALISSLEVNPGMRVLDVGCGSGAVGLAASFRAADVRVHAIDSNPRAVESIQWAANRNNAENVTWALDCDGRSVLPGSFDLVVANPPYYSHFRLAALFAQIAAHALQPGGQALFVTKWPERLVEVLQPRFSAMEFVQLKSYAVIRAVR